MSIPIPCHQKEWDEWKKEMEENRRKRWRERISRLAKVEVSDEEEEGEEEEAEDTESEEEEVSRNEEENEAGEKEEEMEVRKAEEMEEEKENEVGRRVKEMKKGDEEEDREVVEAQERVDVEEEEKEEENEVEREVKENEEVDEEEEKEVKKAEELVEREEEEENELETELKENKEVDAEEEKEVMQAEVEEGETEVENKVEREVEENGEVEEKEEMEGEEMEEEQEEDEFGRDVMENEEVDEEEEKEVKKAEELVEREEEEENEVETELKENKEVDAEEEKEVMQAEEVEEEETEVENKVEREAEENGEVEEKEEIEGEEMEEEQEEDEFGRDVMENEELDEDEEKEVKKAEELVEREEEGENEVETEVKENKEVDGEEKEVTEAEEVEEDEKEVENKVEREVEENGEVGEKEVTEGEEMEEEQEEDEFGRDVMENEEVDEEEDQVAEENDGEEEHQDQELIGQYHLAEQFREQMSRTEHENIQLNQESARQKDKVVNEEEKMSDLVESDDEDSDLTGSDPEELEDPDEKSLRTENSILGAWPSKDRKEEEGEKLADEEEAFPESRPTREEEFQDDHKNLQEEEFTDDEEAEHSTDDDVDNDDEDVAKIYCKDDYTTDIFGTLTEFRDSSLLTDLTLSTEDGKSFHVHSPVLAAVSSLIRKSLCQSNVENHRVEERKDNDTSEAHIWSVSLGPEVDHVGLEAVVEFAYTGLISCLNKDTVHQIKAAAQTLGAARVLDLCTEEEEKSTKTGGQKKEERISATEQMMISLQSIKQLRMDRVGCDVILEALGGSLHVHRVILAVLSDYFRGMFTLGMKESHQPCVSLPFLLASELEVLVDCSYSGALPLSWRCVFEITSTALQLQYQPALSLCLKFLQQEINPNSCLDVASFAKAYEMVPLLEVADDFVLRQFPKVSCTSKFKDLPARQLLKYLNSRSLCVQSELVVFRAVVAWIQAKPKIRLRLAKELMKTIHFPLMTFKEFKEVQSLNMWSDHSLAELYEAIFAEFCSNETAPQSQYRIYMPKESLVLIGGDQTIEDLGSRSISRDLWFGNSLRNHMGIIKAMEWRRLGEMPEPARFCHEVTVLKGQLYLFGGKKYYGISDTLNSVYRYDPLQNSWESLAEMQEKRCSFSVVVLDGKIYAIGGLCDPDYTESVERYCPTAKSWSFTCPLDLPLSGHVAKVVQQQIFVSGGLSSGNQCLASMFLYHPETGSTYLANMAKPRANHCMDALGECLYVAGGITTDDSMTTIDQLACEVYNPVANFWTAFTSLPVPHVGAGSAVLEGKFYVLGGYRREDYRDTKMVHRYDPTTQRWENMGKMPGPNSDIRASLMCLPPHLRL